MNLELNLLARKINDHELAISLALKQTVEKANEAVTEALLQGQHLIRAKALCTHGRWEAWLRAYCPNIAMRTAEKRMALARRLPELPELAEAESLRAAYALIRADAPEQEAGEPRRWPPYLEAINRLGKLAGYFERFPLDQWPASGVEKFKSDLEPIARKLWPERF